jgi:pimeloyl-ACP methyl ester carboxylesterase
MRIHLITVAWIQNEKVNRVSSNRPFASFKVMAYINSKGKKTNNYKQPQHIVAPQVKCGRSDEVQSKTKWKGNIMNSPNRPTTETQGYAPVNGLKMYYEIEGTGDPLVYIPPVFGFAGLKSFPALALSRSVIAVDLQGNGRTADIAERPLSIEQYAKDVVALLNYLGIQKADFFGESYGANTAVMIAVNYPEVVGRVATYGGTFGPPDSAHNTEMLRFDHPPTPDSMSHGYQRENYKKVAPDPDYWPKIWEKVVGIRWEGFSSEQLASIKAPVLIVVGDHDFVRVEHAAEAFKRIPNAELAVIPDASHFVLFSEQERVIPVVKHFLEKPEKRLPLATAEMGYHPGETR